MNNAIQVYSDSDNNNIEPYQMRLGRIFDGARIAMAPAAYLGGAEFIHAPAISHLFSNFLHKFLEEEMLPTFSLTKTEIYECANATIERLQNTCMSEELLSILHHSVSKWRICVLPVLLDNWTKTGRLPELTVLSFAALIVFNRVMIIGPKGDAFGDRGLYDHYKIQDDEDVLEFFHAAWKDFEEDGDFHTLAQRILARDDFWGENLNEIGPLTDQLAIDLRRILHIGITRTALRTIFPPSRLPE